jgi:hypothetical protein
MFALRRGLAVGIILTGLAPVAASSDEAGRVRQPGPDWAQLAAPFGAIPPEATWRAEARRSETPPRERRVQMKGLGVRYQVNKSVAIEGGARLGFAGGSPGAFLSLQKTFGAR